MILMAWDHVSGFWNEHHHGGEGILGTAPPFENLFWFLERFISHICAPTFIFLAGTVLAISVVKRLDRGQSQKDVSIHIIKRGLVLLLLEILIVSTAFGTSWYHFGVIACIGVCLIIFSVYRRLPASVILTLSIIIILNQSFLNLDFVPRNTAWGWYIKVIIHEPNFGLWPYVGSYPIIPWIGVMGLGWGFGKYLSTLKLENIRKLKTPLTLTGIGSIIIFFLVRWTNGYGNLLRRTGSSVIDWLYVSKYPPSIAFLLWTLGWMCIFISLGLALQNYSWYENGITGAILTFGRNPLFFYITHLWIYRMRLPSIIRPEPPRLIYLELWQSVILWLAGLVLLWQLCLSYEKLKKAYPKYLQYV